MDWYVGNYPNAREADQADSDGRQFATFAEAFAELKRRKATGAEEVRIMGPSSATDEQREAIVAAGGVLTMG